MDTIQFNKFSELHNNQDIFFCKTDFVFQELQSISKIDNEVILITGNSDYPITDKYLENLPKNITSWFAQNALSNHTVIKPIPLGLENELNSLRDGHGIGYFDRVSEKEKHIQNIKNIKPTKFIYSNFNISTNYQVRNIYKKISIESDHIYWEENNLDSEKYFDRISEYEVILCPPGNGVDTHRIWEVLYSDRIPITLKHGNYKIYELYESYPIIILNNYEDLKNINLIENKLRVLKEKKFNSELLNFQYWKEKIKEKEYASTK